MRKNFDCIPHKMILHIGSWKREVDIAFSHKLDADTISISKNMFQKFNLPETIDYDCKINARNLMIGPVIGYLLKSCKKSFTPSYLDTQKIHYNTPYPVKGILFISALDQINIIEKTIEGFYLENGEWRITKFPYPGAIYRRIEMREEYYNDLIDQMGDKIFNSYFFDKWETWQILSNYTHLKDHLPQTEKLKNLESLDFMLQQFKTVYLKQVFGCKSKGIIKVEKLEKGYAFSYRFKKALLLSDMKRVSSFIEDLHKEKGQKAYIIQQAISVKKYDNRPFDFRVIMQKDGNKMWNCSSIIARFGKKHSIATNFLLDGFALPGHEALKRVLGLKEREIFLKEQEIIRTCTNVCLILGKTVGNYGDLGIDVIVDENQKIWILEVNKVHDHKFPLYSIQDTAMYHKIVSMPYAYARALSGF
jgi:hypothetical protein